MAPEIEYSGKPFGRHFRSLRCARGITQDVLAERSGLSADTIRRLEYGSFSPSLETLAKLSRGLDLRLSSLFEAYELGAIDEVREVIDLVVNRTPEELVMTISVLRALYDQLDGIAAKRDATGEANPDQRCEANRDERGQANPDALGKANPDELGEVKQHPLNPDNPDPDEPYESNRDERGEANPDVLSEANPDELSEANPDELGGANPDALSSSGLASLGEANPDAPHEE